MGQPAAYHSRGVRAYLVNYNAVHGDRRLAELAARRFVLIDEAGSRDIPMMRAVNPDLPILRYKDIVALHRWMPEFAEVDRDEAAFLHSSEPSAMQLLLRADTATITWSPEQRDLPVAGYRLTWKLDSLGTTHPLVDSVITEWPVTLRLPKSAAILSVQTVLEDSSEIAYGLPMQRETLIRKDMLLWPERSSDTRSADEVHVDIALRVEGESADSVFLVGDWDRNNQLDTRSERVALRRDGGLWIYERDIDVAGIRTSCGYEYTVEAWSGGAVYRFPSRGRWHTNVNNRLINNTYGFYVMNVCSPTWRRSYIDQVLAAFSTQGYSGLFEDDCWYQVANYGVDAFPPEPYDHHTWRSGLYEMLDSIQTAIAPRPAYFNGLHAETADSLLHFTEGGMTEGFAYTHWSGLVRGAQWRNMCNRGLAAGRAGKTWMALGGAPHDDQEGRLYALASYLLVADTLAMYANATDYQEFAHYPEFDIPLGTPRTAVQNDVDELAQDIGGGRLHIREYERGTVIVNAGSTPALYTDVNRCSVRLSGGTTIDGGRLDAAHTVENYDSIPPGTARIFLTMATLEVLRSPVIVSTRVDPGVLPADDSTHCVIGVQAYDASPLSWLAEELPLHVVVDAGEIGGPRELVLTNPGPVAPGVHAWYEGSFSIPVGSPPDSAVLPVTVYSATGLFTVGEVTVRVGSGDPGNLLMNYSFEIDNNDDGVPDYWRGYVKGFDYDTTSAHAVSGSRSIHVRNDSVTDFRGVSVRVEVNQSAAEPLELSGWSKCVDVSGDANNDYALYADITYTDGTPLYGRVARFTTGTHDWEYSSFVIEPEKPIAAVNLYALFRRHTGEAWFDHLALRRYEKPNDAPVLPESILSMDLYPNPARTAVRCGLRLPAGKHFTLRAYDLLGRLRLAREVSPEANGHTTVLLPLTDFEAGLYFLRLASSEMSGNAFVLTLPLLVR
jgi:hypothetical protein